MTERVPQVNELLKKEIGALLLRDLEIEEGVIVTVTRVESTLNLQVARVYISVMPEQESQKVMEFLEREIFSIQQELNKRLRMRPVPKIEWRSETKTKEAQQIEELLDRIKEKR